LKASFFEVKPTLKRLEERFERNQALRESGCEHILTAIEWALAGRGPTWRGFVESLENDGIAIVNAKRQDGTEGLFFIDHMRKAVFPGETLGPAYSTETLRNRCAREEQLIQQQHLNLHL